MQLSAISGLSSSVPGVPGQAAAGGKQAEAGGVRAYLLEISQAARLFESGPKTGNDNLDLLVNRLKSSPLSWHKKEMVLKMAWTLARTGMIEGGADRPALSPEDLRKFLELVAVMEQLEMQKRDISGILKDAERIDSLVESLQAEDRTILKAREAAAPLAKIAALEPPPEQ